MKRISSIFILPLLLLLGCSKEAPIQIFQADEIRQILLDVYDKNGGENWTEEVNWAECDNVVEMDRVIIESPYLTVDLSDLNMTGEFPVELFRITDYYPLKLILSDNYLSGRLPDGTKGRYDIELIDISNNDFTGMLPAGWAANRHIMIEAAGNRLNGILPEAFKNCMHAMKFGLDPQQTGFKVEMFQIIPAEKDVRTLQKMFKEMYGDNSSTINWKSEEDPMKWYRVTWNAEGRCAVLDLSCLRLSELPESLSELDALDELWLEGNELDTLPDMSPMKSLRILDITGNVLRKIPDSFWTLENLEYLNLEENLLYGEIPAGLNKLTRLVYLNLNACSFYGKIPDLDALKNLQYLDLSENTDLNPQVLPAWIAGNSNLSALFLDNSNFIGTIPDNYRNLTRCSHIDLSWNSLSGEVENLLELMPMLENIMLDRNYFTGHLPEFHPDARPEYISLNENLFSGEIPPSWANLKTVQNIHLNACNISGTVPEFFADFKHLEWFDVSENQMSGILPDRLKENEFYTNWHLDNQRGEGMTESTPDPEAAAAIAAQNARIKKAAKKELNERILKAIRKY